MKILNLPEDLNERRKFNNLLMRLMVLYPLLLAIIYFIFVAQDRYISTTQISVKNSESTGNSSISIGLLGAVSPSSEDALYLKEYIESPAMFEYLDKQIGLRKDFTNCGSDIIYGLPAEDSLFNILYGLPMKVSREALLRYYQSRISIIFDDTTNLLHIETQGFNPAFALKFNLEILKESERFINELSHKIIREQLNFVEKDVKESFAKLTKSKDAVLRYQNKHSYLDPVSQAEAASKMIMSMEAQKAQMETDLRNQLTYLKENTPQVISSRNALSSLNKQIEQERAKIAAPKGTALLNTLASEFLFLKGQLDFDTSVYETAMTAAEKTRIEALRKLKVLSVIVAPRQAEEAEYPYRIYTLVSLFIGCFLLYGTLRLILSVIEDHRD